MAVNITSQFLALLLSATIPASLQADDLPLPVISPSEMPKAVALEEMRLHDLELAPDSEARDEILHRISRRDGANTGPEFFALARKTKRPDARASLIEALGRIGYMPAAPYMIESLHSPSTKLRQSAASALGMLRYKPAEPALLHSLAADPDEDTVFEVLRALKTLKSHAASSPLKARIQSASAERCIGLLQYMGDPDIGSAGDIPFLAQYLYKGSKDSELEAAKGIARLSGADFGFVWPYDDNSAMPYVGPAPPEDYAPVMKARQWWDDNRHLYPVQ